MKRRRILGMALTLLGLSTTCLHAADATAPTIVRDRVYAAGGQRLDLCVPSRVDRPTSTIVVFIHGGGFKRGDKSEMLEFCRLYAQAGFVSATLNYRLSGEAAYPAALDDVEAALAWLTGNVRPYDRDARGMVLVGYSAGGTLALLARHERVAARVSVAGPTDLAELIAVSPYPQLETDLRAFLGDATPEAVSPIHRGYIAGDPVFLFHGKDDRLVPVAQAVQMAKSLQDRGGRVLLRVLDGVGHEIMLPINPQLPTLLDELTRFVVAVDAGTPETGSGE